MSFKTAAWSGTLTVDQVTTAGGSTFGCSNGSSPLNLDDCSSASALTDDDFTHGGTDYAITRVNLRPSVSFVLVLDKAWPSDIRTDGVLTVGTTKLKFADAVFTVQGTLASWTSPGFTWTDNQVVPLSITAPPDVSRSVSNITETAHATNSNVTNNNVFATAFTTGGATTDRLTLRSVVVDTVTGGSGELAVSVHPANGSNPGNKIGSDLTGTAGDGNITYTASGITLAGGTTYFVRVARSGSSANRNLTTTASDTDTTTPAGASGWSIANAGRESSNHGSSWSAMANGRSLRFTVNTTTTYLTATNATQTGATLTLHNHIGSWSYKQTAPSAGTCTTRTRPRPRRT